MLHTAEAGEWSAQDLAGHPAEGEDLPAQHRPQLVQVRVVYTGARHRQQVRHAILSHFMSCFQCRCCGILYNSAI